MELTRKSVRFTIDYILFFCHNSCVVRSKAICVHVPDSNFICHRMWNTFAISHFYNQNNELVNIPAKHLLYHSMVQKLETETKIQLKFICIHFLLGFRSPFYYFSCYFIVVFGTREKEETKQCFFFKFFSLAIIGIFLRSFSCHCFVLFLYFPFDSIVFCIFFFPNDFFSPLISNSIDGGIRQSIGTVCGMV